jgi:hypothetical protein
MDTQTIVTSMTDHTRSEGRIFQIGSVAGIVGSLLAIVGNLLFPTIITLWVARMGILVFRKEDAIERA